MVGCKTRLNARTPRDIGNRNSGATRKSGIQAPADLFLTHPCILFNTKPIQMIFRDGIEGKMDIRNTRTPVLNAGTSEEKREQLLNYFHATYDIDEALFKPFTSHDAFYVRAEALRHPLIFYLGHTAVFYINKLIAAKIVSERINPKYESLFAVGVDEMSWDDLNEAHYDWPAVEEVMAYRNSVRETVDRVLRSFPLTMPITWSNQAWAFVMGMEHARIHLETSSVIIRQLPTKYLSPDPLWAPCSTKGLAPENSLVPIPPGTVSLGKTKEHPLYGWDNEYGSLTATTEEFHVSKYLVSNKEFLGFVEDKGYEGGSGGLRRGGHGKPIGIKVSRFSGSRTTAPIDFVPCSKRWTCLGTGRQR
jgi:hypothetical protein